MRPYIYIIILTTLIWFGCGREKKYPYKTADFKPEIKRHLDKLAAEGQLSYFRDTLTDNFFRDSCTKDELTNLLACENPILRVVAFRAIVKRKDLDYFPILVNHLDDTCKVMWWYYDDAGDYFSVSDLMIINAESEKKLSRSQKNSLIDEVLTKHNYLLTAQRMMSDIQPKEKYYSIIRLAAQQKLNSCHDLTNTYSLAKFKKQEDIPLIKNNFSKYTDNPFCNNIYFKAIEVFPDTAFFPLLTKYFNEIIKKNKQEYSDDLKYYCRAVAQYKNQRSLDILTALTKKETYPDSWYFSYNQEHVFKAVHKYNSPIYSDLYKTLKPQMDSIVMKYLDTPDYDDKTTW